MHIDGNCFAAIQVLCINDTQFHIIIVYDVNYKENDVQKSARHENEQRIR